jgi:ABC-2 type transport system ATP-binding protein
LVAPLPARMASKKTAPRAAPSRPARPAPAPAVAPVSPPVPVGPTIVVAKGLGKSFKAVRAVDGVDLEVRKGEIFAFLGPNGAGKSTTIKMLCTLLRPSAGSAAIAGFDCVADPREVRRRIGLVFQERTLDDQLTAEENLRFHAVLYGVPSREVDGRIDRVLKIVDLADRRKDKVSTYSGGMARRLEIARALLHTPAVLFLDEPTVGLDPQTRARLWSDVRRLRAEEGVTVFITTHYMDEAEVADRIAIIDQGKIVALDTPQRLKAAVGLDTVKVATADDAKAAAALAKAGFTPERTATGLVLRVPDGEAAVARIVQAAGAGVRSVSVHRPSLDDVFLHFTGHEIRAEGPEGNAMAKQWMAMSRRGR